MFREGPLAPAFHPADLRAPIGPSCCDQPVGIEFLDMANFRNNTSGKGTPPPNYLARGEQRRLLMLVMLLGLVVVLMFQAANPANWEWLWMGQQPAAQQNPLPEAPADYNTRLQPTSQGALPVGTFISPKPDGPTTQPSKDLLPGLQPELLATVRDDTPFQPRGHRPFFHVLDVLNQTSESALAQASVGEVGFVQMYEQPKEYRGRVVTLRGTVRRAFDLTAPQNEPGIQTYYQLWLRPRGGPNSPIVLYTLSLPAGFPTSRTPSKEIRELREEVTVTGVFYKNWVYSAARQSFVAPLVVAKTVEWQPPVVKTKEPIPWRWLAVAIMLSALFGIGFSAWVYQASNRKAAPQYSELAARYQVDSFAQLEQADLGPDVAETLRQLAEDEETP